MVYFQMSLNVSKTEYLFFHKPSERDDNLLLFPKLNINNSEIERSECLKMKTYVEKNTLNTLKEKLPKIMGNRRQSPI